MSICDQPAVQVRAVEAKADPERPAVAVPVGFEIAGDHAVVSDPLLEHLRCNLAAPVAHAIRIEAELMSFRRVNANEPYAFLT